MLNVCVCVCVFILMDQAGLTIFLNTMPRVCVHVSFTCLKGYGCNKGRCINVHNVNGLGLLMLPYKEEKENNLSTRSNGL